MELDHKNDHIREAARKIVAFVIDGDTPVENVHEASIHRSPGRRFWNAVYTGLEGGPVWRTTGLSDRAAALLVAKKWEAEARAKRARMGIRPRKPLVRVHRPELKIEGGLTQREVAVLLGLSERAIRGIERRAFAKLQRHPELREFWQKYLRGELDEDYQELTEPETAALIALAITNEERHVISKVLRLIGY